MTEPKLLPKIVDCRKHRERAFVTVCGYFGRPRICCLSPGKIMCYGPARMSERGAINAWNKQEERQ